jgi:phage portal protein BeeE
VTAWVDGQGELMFDWLPTHGANAGKRTRLLREDVVHLKDRSDDGYLGRARIDRAAASLQSAIELQMQSTQFSANSVRPSGMLTTEQKSRRRAPGDFDKSGKITTQPKVREGRSFPRV